MKNIQAIVYALMFSLYGSTVIAAWVEPFITDAKIDIAVGYDAASGIYTYRYTIVNPASNFAAIRFIVLDVSPDAQPVTVADKPFMDKTGLVTDGSVKRDHSTYSGKSLSLGVESPTGWYAAIGQEGDVTWIPDAPWGQPFDYIDPGEIVEGYTLNTRVPPGAVTSILKPYVDMGPGSPYAQYGELCGEDNSPCPDPRTFWHTLTTVGPVLPRERVLIDGKGQRSTDVNTFLRYANPSDSTTVTLPANASTYPLAVVFGETIDPGSFSATLNGADISTQFTVNAGETSVASLALANGRNTLVLSIDGLRNDGRTATDTDRLTFIVK